MNLINFNQRDILSILSDIISLLGMIYLTFFLTIKSRESQYNKSKQKANETEESYSKKYLGLPYVKETWKTKGQMSDIKTSRQKKTQKEIKTYLKK